MLWRTGPSTPKRELQHRSDKIGLNNAEGALTGYTKWRLERNMKIFELMERTIRRIDEDSTVQKAAEIMGKEHVGSLVVRDEKEDVGIITERDIMTRIIAENRDLDVFKVKDVMSTPLVTVDKDADPESVIRLMADKRVRRVLVTDVDRIVGVFSTSDLTKLAAMSQ